LIKKLLSVQTWYGYTLQDEANDPVKVVYSLTVNTLNTWRRNEVVQRFITNSLPPTAPIPTSVPSPSQAFPSFHSTIKINILEYPKLEDDNQWRTFDRQLWTTAASYDTMDVLDPTYVLSLEYQDSFRKKQRCMYKFFSDIVLTAKGKNCIRDECDSMDAQKIYAALLEAYYDLLSRNLSANKLRQELTLMKLDDKWCKSFESFIHFWTANDETKRIWLNKTLSI
jgi:hypothetical protein